MHKITTSKIAIGVWKWGDWGWKLSTQAIHELVNGCIDLGVTTFDHADIYGHYTDEGNFGRALALTPSLRQQMQLITKCGIKLVTPNRPENRLKSYDTSRAYILSSVDRSLRALQTDYLDMLLIHRPSPLMNPDEIAEAVTSLQQSGKIRTFGVSNFTPAQVCMLNSRIPVEINQIQCSLAHRSPFLDGTLDQCLEKKMLPMAWSPLGSGKLLDGEAPNEEIARIQEKSKELCQRLGCSLDQLLLAWLLHHPSGIVPILGTARIERVQSAVKALDVRMTDEEWFELWSAAEGVEVP